MKHTIRSIDYATTQKGVEVEPYTRSKAIKAFCTECLGFEGSPVDCTAKMCPLFPYRGRSLAAYGKRERKL